jgi:hypothetical protein
MSAENVSFAGRLAAGAACDETPWAATLHEQVESAEASQKGFAICVHGEWRGVCGDLESVHGACEEVGATADAS